MMKKLIVVIICLASLGGICQEDWKLPMVKDRIQFEFDSKKLTVGNLDLCETYCSMKFMTDLNKKIQELSTNGKIKFWSASSFVILPQTYGAEAGIATQGIKLCTTAESDTIFGKLTLYISQTNIVMNTRSGSVSCLYRIILNKDNYNVKFRNFDYTYYTKATLLKPSEMKIVKLEEEYDEINASTSDKKYWADIKMLVNWYHTTMEELLGGAADDMNFDD